tara:strand:+ start:23973 stop:24887 length:915 start_codon:yes stop_codon:yes gene_type:complete
MPTNTEHAIINGTDFDANTDFKYMKPKINKSGGKSVGILNTQNNSSLCIATPLLLTWGASEFVDEQSGRKQYNMSIQFPNQEYESQESKQFLESMKSFQQKIKDDAIVNSKDWLNKQRITPEVIDALFHPMLTYPKDQGTGEPDYTRSPTLRVKIDYWEDQFKCEIYDIEQNPLFPSSDDTSTAGPMELLTKGSNVALIIRCGGIWFANGKFGVTWKLVQGVVKPKPTMKGKCFIQLSQSDITKMERAAEEQYENEETEAVLEEDTDEEVEKPTSAIQEEPTPVVEESKPKTKKKVVRRKKADE